MSANRAAIVTAALALASSRSAVGQGISVSMGGTTVSLGTVEPGQRTVFPYSTHVTVHSAAMYTVTADAPANFTNAEGNTMPIGRLSYRVHGSLGFAPFASGVQTVVGLQAATAPDVGRTHVLDYQLDPDFGVLPSSDVDPYKATITYGVTAGSVELRSYAWPNPFSPEGDDNVANKTFFHFWLDADRLVDLHIYKSDGITLVTTLRTNHPVAANTDPAIEWLGRDDNRDLAPQGEYLYVVRVNPSQAVDPGLTLASGLISLERGVGAGWATVKGRVTSSQGDGPVVGATVELVRAGGNVAGTQTTGSTGDYQFDGVGAGTYFVRVSAPQHYTFSSGNFEVADGETVIFNVRLIHNHALTIIKKSDLTDVEPGDVIGYTIEVIASGVSDVENVVVHDILPDGLKLVPGSARLNGHPIQGDQAGPSLVLRGRLVEFPVGHLATRQRADVYYEAVVSPGRKSGALVNAAYATGAVVGIPVRTAETRVRVFVRAGDTGDRSLLFGRVFLDVNGNGIADKGEKGIRGARVVIDDGTVIVADSLGRYSVKGLKAGTRVAMAVVAADENAPFVGLVPAGPSKIAFIDLTFGVAARLDFAFKQKDLDSYPGDFKPRTFLGVAGATLGLEKKEALILRLAGRLAGFLERDLGDGYRILAYVDTDHQPRDEMGIGRDELSFQPEVGDRSSITPSVPDKIGVRLTAPWGTVVLGRNGVNFGHSNLVNNLRAFLGVDVGVEKKSWKVRTFAGATETRLVREVIENDGSAGPFQLANIPILPGSDRVWVEGVLNGLVVSRVSLGSGLEYTLDHATGQLFLGRPWPLHPPSGEVFRFVIQYEHAPATEIPRAFIAGARAEAKLGKRATLGATAIHEDETPNPKSAVGVDSRFLSDSLDVAAEAAISNKGSGEASELPGSDETAFRARAVYRPWDDVGLFGYFNQVGGGYTQRTDFQLRSPPDMTFGYLPPPTLSLFSPFVRSLSNGQRGFPFFMQNRAGVREVGLGTSYRVLSSVDVSTGAFMVFPQYEETTETSQLSEYAALNFSPKRMPSLFLAYTQAEVQPGDNRERAVVGASRWQASSFQLGFEGRMLWKDTAEGKEGFRSDSGLLRARFVRIPWLQPAALVEGSLTHDDEGSLTSKSRSAALGVESVFRTFSTFAYASAGESQDMSTDNGPVEFKGAFAGINLFFPRLVGALRFDVSHDTKFGRQFGGGGRARLALTDSVMGFGSVNYKGGTTKDPLAQWSNLVGFAYREPVDPRFVLFLKYKDQSTRSLRDDVAPRRRAQLGTMDLVIPLGRSAAMGTRAALKRARTSAGFAMLSVAGEEVTWTWKKRYDLIAGTRLAGTSQQGELLIGTTVAMGVRFPHGFRLVVGMNYAREEWVFEADDSIPGLFLNLTGTYGSAGAPAEMPY
ncbi:MAG: carboxypeptidase regulatory-like domain-containing protein [Deltaproteobacteria bacterium]|nr:carboxypeptidase regulatory-like domain-containing protein [Deltaproteobacteria bacterium]